MTHKTQSLENSANPIAYLVNQIQRLRDICETSISFSKSIRKVWLKGKLLLWLQLCLKVSDFANFSAKVDILANYVPQNEF